MGSNIFGDEGGHIITRVCGHISPVLSEIKLTGEGKAVTQSAFCFGLHHPLCCGVNL